MLQNMMQQTSFGAESARWPSTRQNWPITTPPAPGMHTATPSAPPDGWQPLNSTSLPGLESLTHLDRLIIDQRDGYTICRANRVNKYSIMSVNGQKLFDVHDNSSCFSRMCCGTSGVLDIEVYDISTQEVLGLHRPFDCCLKIYVPDRSRQIGTITRERTGLMRRLFTTQDLFSVSFPGDLDNEKKALLMAAAIFIDFQNYEEASH